MAFLTIPGNVKQGSVPFSLNPKQGVNGKLAETEVTKGPCNFFSFKPGFNGKQHTFGLINTFPSSLKQYISEDISFKTLYDHSLATLPGPTITWKSLMSTVPSIQIREFLPDSKMDQIFNFFKSFTSGFTAATEKSGGDGDDVTAQNISEKFKQFTKDSKYQLDKFQLFMELLFDPKEKDTNLILGLGPILEDVPQVNTVDLGEGFQNYIMNFPFIMYNRMMGATTTNIYELPFNPQQLYDTKGSAGWESDQLEIGGNFTNSILGKIMGGITSNIRIHQSPVWKPTEGEGDGVEVTFQLFNDFSSFSEDSALNNFIMVNTMVPNNMWTQYHIYQHSPDLYDIKIPGVKRLYMCACDITVDPKGVLRIPSDSMMDRLSGKYLNSKFEGGINAKLLRNNNMIRIPDIYEIKMVFKSLLPNNFNNYLFTYSDSNNIHTQVNPDKLHTDSVYSKVSEMIGTKTSKAWEEADKQVELEKELDALFED